MIQCWHYRRVVSRSLDEGAPLPAPARRHVQECPACRRRFEAEMAVARQLSAGAGSQRRTPSPFLHAKIMSAVARSQPDARRVPWLRRRALSLALGAACMVVAALAFWRNSPPIQAYHPSMPPSLTNIVVALSLPRHEEVRAWTAKLHDPLETELDLVISDTTNALNALADNFLPENVRESLFERRALDQVP